MVFSLGMCNLILMMLLFLNVPIGNAQERPLPKKTDNTPVKLNGAQIFQWYCAPCHGKDAKGNGPLAAVLKVPPPDLTTLSKRSNGKFPVEHVANVLKNGSDLPAHGSAEMPIWGSAFSDYKTHRFITLRIGELTRYLESLQAK